MNSDGKFSRHVFQERAVQYRFTIFFDFRAVEFFEIVRSGPEGPPCADRVLGAEVLAHQTHNAEVTFFREDPVPFHFYKNPHGT